VITEKLENEKIQVPPAVPKSFMTVGPTLHYSHEHVMRFWVLSLTVYVLACLLWSMIVSGSFVSFDFQNILNFENWRIDKFILHPVSIFAYPWQIAVLGLLMGMLAVMPPLLSQLLSFRYSVPLLIALAVIANLSAFAIFVLISCIAAACRPLRFRSRFIALALCITPQLFYWAYFGGLRNAEPLKWGFSFSPWLCAWLTALVFAGIVLLLGHFTRYRPGICWLIGLVTLILSGLFLKFKIGFDELAYQRYVAGNDPEEVLEFRDHSITEWLDATMKNSDVKRYFSSFFYPTEPVMLREKLKEEIQTQLNNDRWPFWFRGPDELDFGSKRQWLLDQYDHFISYPKHWWLPSALYNRLAKQRLRSKRMPAALYYKALLSEMTPDLPLIMEKETLHFYDDYPHWRCWPIWFQLYEQFGNSPESCEARLRLAMHLAGKGLFQKANELLDETRKLSAIQLKHLEQSAANPLFLSSFAPPPSSAVTIFRMTEIQRRTDEFSTLISSENYNSDPLTQIRLAKFVMLDPHSSDYKTQLEGLLAVTDDRDPLKDNILFAKIKLTKDWQLQAEQLNALHEKYKNRDAGIAALYELGILKVRLSQEAAGAENKKRYLREARNTLENFISIYPRSNFRTNAEIVLKSLPKSD
jgi:hypothetical protein